MFLSRALRMELMVYESLWRAATRRPKIAAGATGFRYHRPLLTVLIVFIVLSAVEIPILDLLFRPWLPVRIVVLVLSIWGLMWMLGILCAFLTRPHTVGAHGIRVRAGMELDIPIRWDAVESLARRKTVPDPASTEKPPRVFDEDDERVCAIRVGSETNLEIHFARPTDIHLPGPPPKGGVHRVTVLRFWADEPKAFLESARPFLITERGE